MVPGALYFVWRVGYYGHLLPLPFYVKALVPEGVLPGARESIAFVRSMLLERVELGLGLGVGIAAAPRRASPMLLGALALWLFFFLPAHEMGFDFRYFHPIVPLLASTIALGLVAIRGRFAVRFAMPALLVLLTAHAVLPWVEGSIAEKRAYGAGVEHAHAPLGRALAEVTDRVERPVVASLDCGAIAYHSRWSVVDTWGLNDPTIATTGRRDAEHVLAQRPEVVIVISAERDRFVPHFEHEQALWDRSRALGLEHVASFEFLPDYHLFALARPESPAVAPLVRAGRSAPSASSSASLGRPDR